MAVRKYTSVSLVLLTLMLLIVPATAALGYTDRCTAVADSGRFYSVYFNFNEACAGHDRCYQEYWYERSDSGREACDIWFYNAMAQWCNANYGGWLYAAHRNVCFLRAEFYYAGVNLFGKWFFYSKNLAYRALTPMA